MSSKREINTFPINPTILLKLDSVGFTTVEDFITIKPSELSAEANITPQEALDVLKTLFEDVNAAVRKPVIPVAKSALDLFKEEQELGFIVTFCESLDDMLGGGVPLRKITEFCGAPGIGKTQLCLQLAVDVHIPACLGGMEGEVVYIDTEGSFIVERMVDIATATVEHCKQIQMQADGDNPGLTYFTVDKILAGTHFFRCQDHIELIATVHLLSKFLTQHNKVKLVIVDSIASPFRQDFTDMSLRTRLLSTLAQSFIKIASQFNIAIVLTNQMTTKIAPGLGSSHLIPALGESWGHASTIRIILFWEHNQRQALLYKSPSKQEAVCSFQVTLGGVRDVKRISSLTAATSSNYDANSSNASDKWLQANTSSEVADPPHKKQKKL